MEPEDDNKNIFYLLTSTKLIIQWKKALWVGKIIDHAKIFLQGRIYRGCLGCLSTHGFLGTVILTLGLLPRIREMYVKDKN